MKKQIIISIIILSLLMFAQNAFALVEDFNSNDGGFSVTNSGSVEYPWHWITGSWLTEGTESQGAPTSSMLNSPIFTVTRNGPVLMKFDHRYSFEYDGTNRWDGGQVRLSINGGAYVTVPGANFMSNGYIGIIIGNNILNGQEGFNGDSQDYLLGKFITSELSLGTFNAGDQLSVQFIAAWDEFIKGSVPNWEIDSVETWMTYYVSPGQSIQAVIDDPCTVNGDKIEVAPGTYYESINFNGKAVHLYSSDGPDSTTIDANGAYHVVQCVSGEDANTILEGFTITGGNANGVNWPDYHGGGMLNVSSSPTVSNCKFTGNSSQHWGGGMYNDQGSYSTVTNCTFSGNISETGGGGISNWGSSPTVTNCSFSGNNAPDYGGGMFNRDNSSPTVTNCTFSGNSAGRGGGMFNYWNGNPSVTNCTFTGNSASLGGGMYNLSSNPKVTNCVFWGDTGGEFINDSSYPIVTYSDVQGGYAGMGNINADPCFVDAGSNDFHLLPDSPCIDAGNNDSVPEGIETDLDGRARFIDGDCNDTAVVDMGAYEFIPLPIHNITQDTWYETIQAAIYDTNDGDEIEVPPGTYNEAINFNGKVVRLYSSGGPDMTIIDGSGIAGAYHVVKCVNGEDANTILEGFTITGGNANGPSSPDRDGGGMYNVGSSPTVINCIFIDNKANHGGGMLNIDGNPTVTGCTFQNNIALGTIGGGGMYNHNSSPLVTDCSFIGNSGESWGGGGMFNATGSNPTLISCTFSNNNAVGSGGGIYNWDDTAAPILTNCTFSGNSATDKGGGMFNRNNSSPTVTNCTFSGNTATNYGGGMYNEGGSPTVTNCILWSNSPEEIFNDNSSPIVTYSDVQGGYAGMGNINADPCFVDATNPDPNLWNLRLKPDSPCIDAGDTAAIPSGILVDADGNPRGVDDAQTPDTGLSFLKVTVDMGAYEFQPCRIEGDINCDGKVDFADLAILCNNWLAGTEP